MTLDVEQIKADMEAGTPGRWAWVHERLFRVSKEGRTIEPVGSKISGVFEEDADRIARVPDLEVAFIEHTARIAELEAKAARDEVEYYKLQWVLEDLMSWFPEEPAPSEWRIMAGERGADDAVKAARAAVTDPAT